MKNQPTYIKDKNNKRIFSGDILVIKKYKDDIENFTYGMFLVQFLKPKNELPYFIIKDLKEELIEDDNIEKDLSKSIKIGSMRYFKIAEKKFNKIISQ